MSPSGRARASASLAVAVAVTLDATLREPPLAWHPVRAMGRMLDLLGRRVPAAPPTTARRRGAAALAVGAIATTLLGAAVDHGSRRLRPSLAAVVRGLALWPLMSLAMLCDEVVGVEDGLARDLDAGRRAVARLVSRDVTEADDAQVRAAAIASLAENLSDGLVAPMWWFAIGGLPAAAAYRYLNTADAMWGNRGRRWRHAGWAAARADDLVNLIPSRLTGVALALPAVRLRDLRREATRTASPNGGWPMGAVALRLGVRLDKPGVYALNPAGRPPRPSDTAAALRLVRGRAYGLAIGLTATSAAVVRSRPCRR